MALEPKEAVDRRNLLIILGVMGVLYGALLTSRVLLGQDASLYIGLARSILNGEGFQFNGTPIARAPFGWPAVLAGMMWVSKDFLFLNTVNTVFLLYSVVCGYLILRRITSAEKSLWASLLGGILYWTYSSGTYLRSEAFFCAIFAQTVLWSMQMAEGKRWRLPLILLGCLVMPMIRFAAVAMWVVAAAAMMQGVVLKKGMTPQDRGILKKRTIVIGMTLVVILAGFVGTREVLKKKILVVKTSNTTATNGVAPLGIKDLDAEKDEGSAPMMQNVVGSSNLGRVLSAGQWIASTFWMPAQALYSRGSTALAGNLFGWVVLALMIRPAWKRCNEGSYLLAGTLIYSMAIIARWQSVNTRYLMPISHVLILAAWLGMEGLWASRPRVSQWVVGVFIGSIIAANLPLLAWDIRIARSGARFYQLNDAGEPDDMVSAANYLRSMGVKDGKVATNHFIISQNKQRSNGYALRGLFMLLDRKISVVPNTAPVANGDAASRKRSRTPKSLPSTQPENLPPEKWDLARWEMELGEGKPTNKMVATFCRVRGVKYYLYRPPEATHAWNLRQSEMPKWLGGKKTKPQTAWELYELVEGKMVKVDFPRGIDWPTSVP